MKLFYHTTDGGAEYYTTREDDIKTAVLRTDGDELEIINHKALREAGFRYVSFNGKRQEIPGEFCVCPIINGCSVESVFSGSQEECISYCRRHKGENEFIITQNF